MGDRLTEPLDPLALSLEGTRWADEHERIRQVLVHDGIVLSRSAEPPPPADTGPPLIERVLASVDKPRRLDELYQLVQGSRFRFLEATYAMLVAARWRWRRLDEESGASQRDPHVRPDARAGERGGGALLVAPPARCRSTGSTASTRSGWKRTSGWKRRSRGGAR